MDFGLGYDEDTVSSRWDTMSRTRGSNSVHFEQQVRSSGPAQQQPGAGQHHAQKGPQSKKNAAKPLPKKGIMLGMDLGTEYSKVYARLLAGQGSDVTIHLFDRSPEICSHALVSNSITPMDASSTLQGEWVKFGPVRSHRHQRYHHLRCWKKYIGATINDVDVDKVSEEFGGLKIVSDGSPEQFMAIQVTPHLAITPHQLLIYLLTFIKSKVPQAYVTQHTVLTLPVAANNRLRQKYIDAASGVFEVPRDQVHLVGEPLAGLYSRLRDLGADDEVDADAQELEDKAMVVLDVGAGTTDLVVLYKRQVLAAHGNNWLGGSDVDMLLLNCVPDNMLQGAKASLLDCLRRAKEQLCRDAVADPDADPASLWYEEVQDPVYAGLRVTWADLVEAAQHLREPLVQALRDLLDMAGLPPAQVGRVVGMGGAFDLPCVGDAIREVFDEDVAVDPTAGGAAREIVQGAVDLLHKKVVTGRSGLTTVPEAGSNGLNRLLPSPETFLNNLPLSQPIHYRRGVYMSQEWKQGHMKERELRSIKAGLLSRGQQLVAEEAVLDACMAAKRKGAAKPPQGVPEVITTLEQLLTGRECPPCTTTVPGHLVSYSTEQVNITFDLYQGLPRCAVYIGSAKIPLMQKEHLTAQVTVDANHCIGVELNRSNGEVQQLQLSWDKVCAEVSRAGHARRTELLKPAARAFLTAGSEQPQPQPAGAGGGDPAAPAAVQAAVPAVLPPLAALAAAPLLQPAAAEPPAPPAEPGAADVGCSNQQQGAKKRLLPAALRGQGRQQLARGAAAPREEAPPAAAGGLIEDAGPYLAPEAPGTRQEAAAAALAPAVPAVRISRSAAAATVAAPLVKTNGSSAAVAAPMVKVGASGAALAAIKAERHSGVPAAAPRGDQDPEPAAAEGAGRWRGRAGGQQAAAAVPIKRSAPSGPAEPGAGVPALPALGVAGRGKRSRH